MKIFTLILLAILLNSCGNGEQKRLSDKLRNDIKVINLKLQQTENTIKEHKCTTPTPKKLDTKDLDSCRAKLTQSTTDNQKLTREIKAQKATIVSLNQIIIKKDNKIKKLIKNAKTNKHITTIDKKMWQDEPYTAKEKKAYNGNNKNFGKAGDFKYATAYCKDLKLGRYNDWRLPTKDELKELYKKKSQLKNMHPHIFWSNKSKSDTQAWVVNFNLGLDYLLNKANNYFVRCVR